MARFAVLKNNIVNNIVESDPTFAQAQGWIPALTALLGDVWDGTNFTTPPLTPDQQAAIASAALAADADTAVKNDTLIATWKAKNWATYSADFDALTTANKLELLKRAAFAVLHKVL
jgi:hypothetical protein